MYDIGTTVSLECLPIRSKNMWSSINVFFVMHMRSVYITIGQLIWLCLISSLNRLKKIWHLNLIYVPDFCHAQVLDALTKHQIKTDDLVEYVRQIIGLFGTLISSKSSDFAYFSIVK